MCAAVHHHPIATTHQFGSSSSECFPFDDSPVASRPSWMGAALLIIDLVIVPLRVLLVCCLFPTLWLLCRICMIGTQIKMNNPQPLSPWRSCLIQACVRVIFTLLVFTCGTIVFVHQPASKQPKHPLLRWWAKLPHPLCYPLIHNIPTGLIVSNHVGVMDALIYLSMFPLSLLSKVELHEFPTFGTIFDALECLFITRSDPNSRAFVLAEMIKRIKTRQHTRFLLFPEGTASNGHVVLRFQKGVFSAGVPVVPIAVKSHYKYSDISWPNRGMIHHVGGLFSALFHVVHVHISEQYVPNAAELADPVLYANNVQHVIAQSIGVPTSTLSMFDNPELKEYFAAKHHKAN